MTSRCWVAFDVAPISANCRSPRPSALPFDRLHPANWCCQTTLRGNQDRLEIAAAGGAGRRSAKNAAKPLNQSREALLAAWPLHSPEGGQSAAVFAADWPHEGA
jgi:hypothetical protein